MDSKGANIPMGPNGLYSELIYLVGIGLEGWIGSKFTIKHKSVLIITQDCIEVSE